MFVHVHNLLERMKSLENPLHVITVVEILLPNSSVLDQQPCAPNPLAGSMMVFSHGEGGYPDSNHGHS